MDLSVLVPFFPALIQSIQPLFVGAPHCIVFNNILLQQDVCAKGIIFLTLPRFRMRALSLLPPPLSAFLHSGKNAKATPTSYSGQLRNIDCVFPTVIIIKNEIADSRELIKNDAWALWKGCSV